ncbi:MAG: hypothetical protein U0790_12995 [Isosphaeraceae bacterium]
MTEPDRVFATVSNAASSAVAAGPRDLTHTRSRLRPEIMDRPSLAPSDEVLVVDERCELRPAQVVESKLTRMLKDASLPVSHLQMRGLLRNR